MKNFPKNFFDFNEVSEDHIFKLLKSLDGTKSMGYDKIPASLIKTAAEELSLPTMNLVNRTICNTKFPTVMRLSEISPIFKTSDTLETGNYRPLKDQSGHRDAAVLLPGFAITWKQNQVARQLHLHNLTQIYLPLIEKALPLKLRIFMYCGHHLVLSGNKPLPEPMLTHINDAIWHLYATMCW